MNSTVAQIIGESGDDPKVKIEIECNKDAAAAILPLLRELKRMGDQGSSRGIKIEDWDGKNNFEFDGDGPDRITSLKADSKEWDE